jgi:hypothetical protein
MLINSFPVVLLVFNVNCGQSQYHKSFFLNCAKMDYEFQLFKPVSIKYNTNKCNNTIIRFLIRLIQAGSET